MSAKRFTQNSSPVPATTRKFGYAVKSPPTRIEWADAEAPAEYAKYQYSNDTFKNHAGLPFELISKSGTVSKRRLNGELIYDVQFTIDSYARRVTGKHRERDPRDEFLIFLGCSFTFGDGLKDNETLPYFVSEATGSKGYRAYNYGFSGASLGHLLARLQVIDGRREIPESGGWIVLPFIDAQLARLVGRMSIIGSGLFSESTHFFLDASGELASDGMFKDAWPIRTKLFRFLVTTNLVKFFNVDFPSRYSEKDFQLASRIFALIQKKSITALNAKGLIVVFFPGQELAKRLIPFLEASGIHYLDYSGWEMSLLTKGPALIPYDGHPTAETNQILGRSIASEIMAIDHGLRQRSN